MLKLRTSNSLADRMGYRHHAVLTVVGREHLAQSVIEGRLTLHSTAASRWLSRQENSALTALRNIRRRKLLRDRRSALTTNPVFNFQAALCGEPSIGGYVE